MATASVTNDLQTPIEVAVQVDWRVLYPQKSCDVGVLEASAFSTSSGPEFKGEALIQVRLRESPGVRGSCLAAGGASLKASVDFGAFSQRCKGRDRAEARELAREGTRRKEAQERMDMMIKEAATKKRNKKAWHTLKRTGAFVAILLALLLVCAAIPPESEVAAALLASATVPLCGLILCINICAASTADNAFNFRKYALFFRLGFWFACLLALLALVAMSALHALQRYVYSSVLVSAWAAGGIFCFCFVSWDSACDPRGLNKHDKKVLKRERKEALCEISNRTIRFEGSVISWPRGRPCVASWPGKYAGA
ncbi:unnamed protein product [Symbiodinium natans]|uniref:Uncharacterized protein n=1 Tax=Symbiodinium natans TaxID=878477 RepID=A0A812Q1M9_9DINO|nr:unnamed protein product [Symbiodinium natans]